VACGVKKQAKVYEQAQEVGIAYKDTTYTDCHYYKVQFQVLPSDCDLQLASQAKSLTSMNKARLLLPENYGVRKQLKILF